MKWAILALFLVGCGNVTEEEGDIPDCWDVTDACVEAIPGYDELTQGQRLDPLIEHCLETWQECADPIVGERCADALGYDYLFFTAWDYPDAPTECPTD